jgi:hypothetical protein
VFLFFLYSEYKAINNDRYAFRIDRELVRTDRNLLVLEIFVDAASERKAKNHYSPDYSGTTIRE